MRLGALLWRACRLGGGMLSPRTRGPSVPSQITPNSANLREHHCATCWRPEALKTTPTLTPQVHLPGRCAPDNQRHGQSPTPHRPLAATKVSDHRGCRDSALPGKQGLASFVLCALFSFIFFDSFLLIAVFNFYVCTLYISYFYFHGTLIVFLILGFRIFNKQAKIIWCFFSEGSCYCFSWFSFLSIFFFGKSNEMEKFTSIK